MKPAASTSSMSYYSVDGEVDIKMVERACFSTFGYSADKKVWNTIKVYLPKRAVVLEDKELDVFIEDLCSIGFICKREEDTPQYHVVSIPLNPNPDFKYKKLYYLSIMILLRFSYHTGLTSFMNHYFRDRTDNCDKFELIRTSHKFSGYYNSNHSLSDYDTIKVSKKELFDRIKKSKNHLPISITESWGSKW